MGERAYGRIRMSEDDLRIVRKMLSRGLETVSQSLEAATEEDERRYYAATKDRYERELSRFVRMKPGVAPMSEDDLVFVRGSVFPVLQPELMGRWAAKHELDDLERSALEAEIDHLADLERRFAQPFLKDHSQDPGLDDDEDDEASALPSP